MKIKKFGLLVSVFLFFFASGFSQKGVDDGSQYGHGKDSIRCIRNYTLYRESYDQKNYLEAFPYWRMVYAECPRVRKSIYIHGANMYKFYTTKAINKKEISLANSLIDTLMMVYDQRVKWYPSDKARILGYKANDLMRFKRKDPEYMKKVYDYSSQAIKLKGNFASKANLATYMSATLALFQQNIITDQEVVENYARSIGIIDAQLEKKPDSEELDQLKEQIGTNFANSGAASCKSLISLFTPQFKKNPGDVTVLKKIIFWLGNTDCTDSDLFLHANIAFNKKEPSANLAYHIAQLYNKRGNYQ